MLTKVTVAISTHGSRVNQIKIPAYCCDVCYYIIHQNAENIMLSQRIVTYLKRVDVTYCPVEDVGLSRSRNFALSNIESEYIHIMDDDVDINALAIRRLAEQAANEQILIAVGRFSYGNGNFSKSRKNARKASVRDFFSVCSIEMCIARRVLKEGVFFDSNFGLGSRNPTGEELIFLMDARRKGLVIKYFPVSIGTHSCGMSGNDFFSSRTNIVAKKNMFKRAFPKTFLLWKIVFFIRKFPVLWNNKKTVKFFCDFF